jgi:hypothetical protein
MDRRSVKSGLRFAREVAREYARVLAQSGEVDTTFATMRKMAILYGSEWLQENTASDFASRFEELVDEAISPILANPSFRNADEMDQIATYGSQAVMAIVLEDAGFGSGSPVEPDFLVLLQRPWTSTFGSSVFLIR